MPLACPAQWPALPSLAVAPSSSLSSPPSPHGNPSSPPLRTQGPAPPSMQPHAASPVDTPALPGTHAHHPARPSPCSQVIPSPFELISRRIRPPLRRRSTLPLGPTQCRLPPALTLSLLRASQSAGTAPQHAPQAHSPLLLAPSPLPRVSPHPPPRPPQSCSPAHCAPSLARSVAYRSGAYFLDPLSNPNYLLCRMIPMRGSILCLCFV